jgi:hypothetical protein
MENVEKNIFERNHPRVIVRGWDGEPVELYLYRIDTTHSYVGSATQKHPVGFPHEQVFIHRYSTLYSLQQAFKRRNITELSAIYANITKDDYACNKYHDNLEYLHDQEHITDPECATSGNDE